MQALRVQARHCRASRQSRQCVNGGDAGPAQLEALALAHVRHQHQVALLSQPLLNKGAPATVVTGHVFWNSLRVKGIAKGAVALAQQLVPGPELIGGVALEAAATEIELKVIRTAVQQWCQQLAVGRGLHQKGGLGLGGELALDRDVAPLAKGRGLLDAAQQIGRSPHLFVAERGLVDESKALCHRRFGGGVVGLVLLAR